MVKIKPESSDENFESMKLVMETLKILSQDCNADATLEFFCDLSGSIKKDGLDFFSFTCFNELVVKCEMIQFFIDSEYLIENFPLYLSWEYE